MGGLKKFMSYKIYLSSLFLLILVVFIGVVGSPVCLLGVAGVDTTTSEAQRGELIDRIVAVVEDRAIFESDLQLEVTQYLIQMGVNNPTEDQLKQVRSQVLEGMVSDRLMAIHAEKEGIEVKDEEVDDAVERAIEDSKASMGGEEAFKRQLELEGITIEQLRAMYAERLRSRMLIERLMYRDLLGKVEVTEREVREYYEKHIEELPKRPATISLSQILIIPRPSSTAEKRALEKVKMLQDKLRNGADFAELAKEFSEGPSAKYGGSLGYVNLEDLNNPAFEDAVKKLKVGEISGPVLTEFGYHLIKLEDIRDGKYFVRHILVRVQSSEEDRARASKLADSLRTAILEGADFAELARRFSDDPGSREKGGVVGEIPLKNLPDEFIQVIRDVKPGELAPVIEDKKGFRVIKVLAKNPERPFTYAESREELKRVIRQEKLKAKYDEYVEKLKKLYYVEIKEKL